MHSQKCAVVEGLSPEQFGRGSSLIWSVGSCLRSHLEVRPSGISLRTRWERRWSLPARRGAGAEAVDRGGLERGAGELRGGLAGGVVEGGGGELHRGKSGARGARDGSEGLQGFLLCFPDPCGRDTSVNNKLKPTSWPQSLIASIKLSNYALRVARYAYEVTTSPMCCQAQLLELTATESEKVPIVRIDTYSKGDLIVAILPPVRVPPYLVTLRGKLLQLG